VAELAIEEPAREQRITQFTDAQERALTADPRLVLLTYLLVNRWTLDEITQALRNMAANRSYDNSAELRALENTALDKMKKLEFDLRKRTDTTSDDMYLSGADEAPTKYRPLVDEYFRALSKGSAPAPKAAGK